MFVFDEFLVLYPFVFHASKILPQILKVLTFWMSLIDDRRQICCFFHFHVFLYNRFSFYVVDEGDMRPPQYPPYG